MPKKLTSEEFIRKSKEVHGNKYDYSLVEYNCSRNKIKIICKKHGIFEVTPNNHLRNRICPKCNNEIKKLSLEKFIEKSNIIHQNKYDYSLVEYIRCDIKIKIIYPIHGIFEQQPQSHLRGHGCYDCKYDSDINKIKFIENSNIIHQNKYDYSLVNYKDAKRKVKIICKKHGIFEITPNNHLRNRGCSRCSESKGEEKIKFFLDNNNIKYVTQKTFKNCKNKNNLKFDIYISELDLCIEYDGKQHYSPIKFFGGEHSLNKQKENDKIKNEYCKQNNIHLLRIRYDSDILTELKLKISPLIGSTPMAN